MKLLLSKIWGWAFKSSLYLEKLKKVMANLSFSSSYIRRPCWFSVVDGNISTILFEILTDDNVGIDIKTKSLDSLIRQIFVIE